MKMCGGFFCALRLNQTICYFSDKTGDAIQLSSGTYLYCVILFHIFILISKINCIKTDIL